MSSPKPETAELHEYRVLSAPPGVHIPTGQELLRLCTEDVRGFPKGLAFPPDAPTLWIKYGKSVIPNEVPAQIKAYHELQKLGSSVRVPRIFYVCLVNHVIYIVMDYIAGKTAGQLLKDHPEYKRQIFSLIAFSLQELHRIPVPSGSRPAGMRGGSQGFIRHPLFDEEEAPLQYQNVFELETHLNEWLKITKRPIRVKDLSLEPMVFCYGDLWLGNFILEVDRDKSSIAIIDFADVSILPSSFSKFVLVPRPERGFEDDMNELVRVPSTDGVDNTNALLAAAGPMVMGPASFTSCGRRVLGTKTTGEKIRRPKILPNEAYWCRTHTIVHLPLQTLGLPK